MLLDGQMLFSDAQTITAACFSENTVYMGKGEIAFGTVKPLLIQVVEEFNNLTSLKVEIQTAGDENFSSPVTLVQSEALKDELKPGYTFPINTLVKGNKGYMRIKYTPNGTAPTSGKITACVVASRSQGYHDI